MKIYNEVTPSSPCPVCKAALPPVRPTGTGTMIDIPNTDFGDVVCITVCLKCHTFLDYNMTKDSVSITKTETIEELKQKDPLFALFQKAALDLISRTK